MAGVSLPLVALKRALRGGLRLVALSPASPAEFLPSPVLFASLVLLDFALMFVFAFAAFGADGYLNLQEIPRALMFVPLTLALGLLARRVSEYTDLLVLPVAFAAVGVAMTSITSLMYVLAQHQWLPFVETYWSVFDDFALGWSAAIVFIAVLRIVDAKLPARVFVAVAGVALLVLPELFLPQGVMWMPRHNESADQTSRSFYSLAEEKAFYTQQGALERELEQVQPQRPGIPDLYVVAAALYAGEDVFMKEVKMITDLLARRFDTAGRAVTLINNTKTLEAHPIASLTSISESLNHLANVMNIEEDVLVLYVSSHGSDNHELVVDFRPLRFHTIDPPNLKAALDESGIRWKVIVISACYSGGFIDALKDERTLIITASSADRTSFGCGSTSDATYLAQALFGEALKETYSVEVGFERAKNLIEQWERDKGFTPSQPQMYVGAEIRAKLAKVEQRLSVRSRQ